MAFLKASGKLTEIGGVSQYGPPPLCTSRSTELWASQPVKDAIPFSEGLKEYHAILSQFTTCISSSRTATQRCEEIEAVRFLPLAPTFEFLMLVSFFG